MAFFVSKDLEGRVDENSLLEDAHSENIMKEFVFQVEEVVCQINKLVFSEDLLGRPLLEINCEGNIHAVDKITFTDSKGIIFLKNRSIDVHSLTIVKILKKDSDNYTISVNGITAKGTNNV